MGFFSFLKIKKNSLDVFLSKKLSVEDKLDYALKELDKRAFQYKEDLIDLVARRDSLKDSLEDFQKKVKSTKKEASTLKAEGKESLAKSKVMVMLSYQQAPESVLPLGRVRIVARGNTVHHQDAGVCRGDKEDGNHHQGQCTEPFGKGEALEEREQQDVGLAHQS